MAGLALAVTVAGCQRRDADSSSQGTAPASEARPPEVAALPRDGITVADRATWRTHLPWPDDCEDAFRASHAGDAGGITFASLGRGVSLVEVTCAAGSYQPSARRFKLIEDAGSARSVPLSFPVYSSENGRDLSLSQEIEVWGESVVNEAAAEIVILTLARQTADCGVWTRYSLAGDQPTLLAAAARVQCPPATGPAARLFGFGPPAGWTAFPRKD
jgi:hypothetical protein